MIAGSDTNYIPKAASLSLWERLSS